MTKDAIKAGRLLRAPENFLDPVVAQEITANGLSEERRGFLRKSFLAASAAMASGVTFAQGGAIGDGDPNILNLPEHSTRSARPWRPMVMGFPPNMKPISCAASRRD